MNTLKLLNIAVEKGFLTERQRNDIVEYLEQAKNKGESVHLESLLMKKRLLTIEQLQMLLSLLQPDKATIAQGLKDFEEIFSKPKNIVANIGIGSQVGPFTLQKLLGTGGMGAVYLAQQKSPKREVALKVMTKMPSSKKIQSQRFLQEVELTSQFDHPNIVKTYLAGIENSIPYLAMECIDGIPLDEYSKNNKLTLRQKLRIFSLSARALHYAHQKGIIHRDIKPSNIMITPKKEPVIMDFGIAKSNRVRDKKLTAAGEVIGTPMYMAPEQIKGAKDLDARADIYSLGSVMYEIITGSNLFPGETGLRLLYKSMSAIPVMPREMVDIPINLEAIIIKCIEKKRENRYPSMLELAEDLEKFIEGREVKATKKYKLRQTRLRMTKYKKLLVTSLVFLCILSFSGYFYFFKSPEKSDSSENKKMKLLANWDGKRKSLHVYKKYIKITDQFHFYDQGIKICNRAIELFKQKKFFQRKKAYYLFYKKNYFASSKAFSKLDKMRDILFYGKSLYYLKEYENAKGCFSKITLRFLSKTEQEEYYFYFGSSIVRSYFEDTAEYGYLERIRKNKIIQKKKALEELEKAKKCLTKIEKKERRALLFLGYANIDDHKKALQYFDKYKKQLKVGQKDILLLKGLGILSYCKGDLKSAINCFKKCSEQVPWEGIYYHLIAQVYIQSKPIDIDNVFAYCIKALDIKPHDIEPVQTLIYALFKIKEFSKILTFYSFFVDYLKTERFQIKPNLWEKETLKISDMYLRKSSIKKADNTADRVKHLFPFFLSQKTLSSEFLETLFLGVKDKDKLLNFFKTQIKLYPQKFLKIKKLIEKLQEVKKRENEKVLRTLMVRFINGNNEQLLRRIIAEKNNIIILKSIWQNTSEKSLVRYWAASILAKSQNVKVIETLIRNAEKGEVSSKLLSLAVLFDNGFKHQFINEYGYIKKNILNKISYSKFIKNREILALFLHSAGKYLSEDMLVRFLSINDDKIKVIAAKNLVMAYFSYSSIRKNSFPYKKKALEILAHFFKHTNPSIRMYAYYWFQMEDFTDIRQYANYIKQNNIRKIFAMEQYRILRLYQKTLVSALQNEENYKVRIAITQALKSYRVYERLFFRIKRHNFRRFKKEALMFKSQREYLAKRIYEILKKEKKEIVKINILNTLIYLNQLDLIIHYVFREPYMENFSRLFPFGMVSLRLGYSDGEKETVFKDLQSEITNLKRSLKKLGPLVVFTIARLGRRDIQFPASVKMIMQMFISKPMIKALKMDDSTIRMVAGYSSIMVEETPILLYALKKQYKLEKNKEVKACILTSILYLAQRHDKHNFQKYYKMARNSEKWIRKIAAYSFYYHVDKWSIYEWIEHWISGVTVLEKMKKKIRYLDQIYCSIVNDHFYMIYYQPKKIIKRINNRWKSFPPRKRVHFIKLLKRETLKNLTSLMKHAKKKYSILYRNLLPHYRKLRSLKLPKEKNDDYYFIQYLFQKVEITKSFISIIEELDNAIGIYPENSYYYFTKSYFLDVIGETKLALKFLRQAIHINKKKNTDHVNTTLYYYQEIRLLLKQSKLRKAQKRIAYFQKRHLCWSEISFFNGIIQKRKGNWKKALGYFWQAYVSSPRSPRPLIEMADIYLFQKKKIKAKEYLFLAEKIIAQEHRRIAIAIVATDARSVSTKRELFFQKGCLSLCKVRFYIQDGQYKLAQKELQQGIKFCYIGKWDGKDVPFYNYNRTPFTKENVRKYPEFRNNPKLGKELPAAVKFLFEKP